MIIIGIKQGITREIGRKDNKWYLPMPLLNRRGWVITCLANHLH
jgi:hypothetical protein